MQAENLLEEKMKSVINLIFVWEEEKVAVVGNKEDKKEDKKAVKKVVKKVVKKEVKERVKEKVAKVKVMGKE